MESEATSPLHILFFPLMLPGHMIPMVDMAKLFVAHGAKASVLTTPANGPLVQSSLGSCPIAVTLVHFPSGDALGSPEAGSCDIVIASVASPEQNDNFLRATALLRQPFYEAITALRPDCVVTDMFLPWTADVAAEHGVPRLVFHGTGFFALSAMESLDHNSPLENLPPEAESFFLPGLPHRIMMLTSQIPDHKNSGLVFAEIFSKIKEVESKNYGIVVNSFYELEPDYAVYYREMTGVKAWHIGPVSLCNNKDDDGERMSIGRGKKSSTDPDTCLKWLDSKNPNSVLFMCFGSLCEFTTAQLREMALGLEASSNLPFIWVVRDDDGINEWLPQGYEGRIDGRGLIIRGWAPQRLILNHEATGGFVTHCGWNSCLEGISAGVPMVTWPVFAEQFYNERLIIDVLRIGVSIGVKGFVVDPAGRELVESEEIKRAVGRLMDTGEESEGRRSRVKRLVELARKAVKEGGSSYRDIGNLIKELIGRRASSTRT